MNFKYILNIFIIVIIIISILLFLHKNINFKQFFREGMDTNLLLDKSDAFCENYRGSSGKLNEACGKLTNNNCNSTSCCVLSNDKCVAGNTRDGPTYK